MQLAFFGATRSWQHRLGPTPNRDRPPSRWHLVLVVAVVAAERGGSTAVGAQVAAVAPAEPGYLTVGAAFGRPSATPPREPAAPSAPAAGSGYLTVGGALGRPAPSPPRGPTPSPAPAAPREQPATIRRVAADPPPSANLPQPLPQPAMPAPTTPQPPPLPADADQPAEVPGPLDPESAALDAMSATAQPLTLPEAINLAFRMQPRLRAQLEAIEQAKGLKGIAYSAFLPTVAGAYRVGGIDLHTGQGKTNTLVPSRGAATGTPTTTSSFATLPGLGAVPANLAIESAFELAELKVQWLVLDFGRRLSGFEQAKLAGAIAQLQTDRAFQTVANDVAIAYYGVLRTRALRRTAAAAVRLGQANLADARKLQREGAAVRETVLRAEVLAAETRQALRAAAEDEFVALAALSLAIGLKGSGCVQVQEPTGIPEFPCSLAQALDTAIKRRAEFQVARRTVEIAAEGTKLAKAQFAPVVLAEGGLFNVQQASPTIFVDQLVGNIALEWKLFEGGRKIAAAKIADSRVREAMAQAESLADNIAFQVNEAFRRLNTTRLGIDDARPAVDQTRENYRLVRARALEGNSTPAEITDALASATRSEQNYENTLFNYLTALSRLEYAMGTTPTPAALPAIPVPPRPRAGANR